MVPAIITAKEWCSIKLMNGNSRKIIWMSIATLGTIVSSVFVFGKQYQQISDKLNSIPTIEKKIQEHDNVIRDIPTIKRDIREIKEMQGVIITHLMKGGK